MSATGWASIIAVLLGLVAGFGVILITQPGYWPFALVGAILVGVLVLALGLSILGRWHPLVGFVAAGLLLFILFAPVLCATGVNGEAHTSCTSAVGVSLPGYTGTGGRFSPNYVAPLAIGIGGGLVAAGVSRRTRAR